MGKTISAVITPVLAAGSTTSPYYVQVNISQRLCHSSCVDSTPSFFPTFSVLSTANVGTNQYVVTIHVEGVVVYIPCDGNSCCTKTQLISQNFTIPVSATTAPTSVTVSSGTPVNTIAGASCQRCSRQFVNETPITLTVA